MANDKNIQLLLKGVRLSFFNGRKPQERRDDKTKELTGYNFNTSILLDKVQDKAQIEAIQAAIKKAIAARWGENVPRIPGERRCLRDGEPKDEDTGERVALYDGYAGCAFLSANRVVSIDIYEAIKRGDAESPVKIIGPKKGPKGTFEHLKAGGPYEPYSGCYANVVVNIYAYDGKKEHPDRVNASLEAVQFMKHGEAFSAKAIDVDSVFEEVEGDEIGGSKKGGDALNDDDGLL